MKTSAQTVAYLFGGTSGIGLCTARKLVRAGGTVAVFGRNRDRIRTVVEELQALGAGAVYGVSADVTDYAGLERAFVEAVEVLGPPNLVINTAGRAVPGYFSEISNEAFRATIEVNLMGSWHVAKVCAAALEAARGHLVLTSSLAGIVGTFGYTDYCASKFGVIGLAEALRAEWQPRKIGVSVLCPPDTETPGFHRENETKPPETLAVSAGARVRSGETVADELIRGLKKNRFRILPGGDARRTVYLKERIPSLVFSVMDKMARKVDSRAMVR